VAVGHPGGLSWTVGTTVTMALCQQHQGRLMYVSWVSWSPVTAGQHWSVSWVQDRGASAAV